MIICFTIDSFGDLLFQEKNDDEGWGELCSGEKTTYIDACWHTMMKSVSIIS